MFYIASSISLSSSHTKYKTIFILFLAINLMLKILVKSTGNVTVTVTCERTHDNATMPDENCNAQTKPETIKSCYAGECIEIYKWTSSKSPCSVTCGDGRLNISAQSLEKS